MAIAQSAASLDTDLFIDLFRLASGGWGLVKFLALLSPEEEADVTSRASRLPKTSFFPFRRMERDFSWSEGVEDIEVELEGGAMGGGDENGLERMGYGFLVACSKMAGRRQPRRDDRRLWKEP